MKKNLFIAMAITLAVAGWIVWAVAALDGAGLYTSNCAGCHGPLATSGKNGATVLRIQTAIGNNTGNMGTFSTLSADQIQAIADALAPPAVYDAGNFSVDGRKWQPVPTGHVAGKDNGPGEAIHHPGEDCGICHTPGGKAGTKVWTMSGTVYDSRQARTPLAGAEIIFQNISGQTFSMTSNELGNFWTDRPFFNNPNNTDPKNWHYKAWAQASCLIGWRTQSPGIGKATDGSEKGTPRRESRSCAAAGPQTTAQAMIAASVVRNLMFLLPRRSR